MYESPYHNLPSRAFWRTGVTERVGPSSADFYSPHFKVDGSMKIATAGSCFAQHVGRALRDAGFQVVDAEPPPPLVPEDVFRNYGFGLYSARYGNIYTARQLLQLWREANGSFVPAVPVWERDGRYYDAQRPTIEVGGFESPESVHRHRAPHLAAVRRAFKEADIFVFTFGLTETWCHATTGTVYPTCPGIIAGAFAPDVFSFKNLSFAEVYADFLSFRTLLMEENPIVKFVLTVSPVPLTATATQSHVEVANAYSKSVLRAVCGQLVTDFENVDYFPSYELITSQKNAARFYSTNLREVTEEGVKIAMNTFLEAHGGQPRTRGRLKSRPAGRRSIKEVAASPDLVCEEALLEAFQK